MRPVLRGAAALALLVACSDDPTQPDYDPQLNPADFMPQVTNQFFPLAPGTTHSYEGETDEGTETTVVEVLDETKTILGIAATVVRDRVFLDGELIEDTFDWFAQQNTGDVWYLGEDSKEIENGEVVVITEDGLESLHPFAKLTPRPCIFEYIYFSRPDSIVGGRNVYDIRKQMGVQLAREAPAKSDVIIPIPDSGVPAAIGYAQESGTPFELGIIRNHYIGRTFIEPRQSIRHFGVRVKLNPVRSILEGQRVVLVDDSIVRGTTSRKIVKMVRAAGAREVHMRISCPPTISPCFYGVDTPRRAELIAATHTLREIQKYIEADSLGYLSLEGMLTAVGPKRGNYCTSCYTGQYPVAFPRNEAAYLQLALKLDTGTDAERAASEERVRNDERVKSDGPRVTSHEGLKTGDELSVMNQDEEDVKLGAGKR